MEEVESLFEGESEVFRGTFPESLLEEGTSDRSKFVSPRRSHRRWNDDAMSGPSCDATRHHF